jgi:DNA-nicking Smr family endonuclease
MPRKRARQPPRDPFDPFDAPVDHTMDLHGLRAAEARAWVTTTVDSLARNRPGALVHIITGKGRGSAGPPVLRRTIGALLRSGQLRHVETWATDLDGGGYLVKLKGKES